MTTKKTADESLLDAQLDFIMKAPDDQFEEYLSETGANKAEMTRKATAAFDRAIDNTGNANRAAEALAILTPGQQVKWDAMRDRARKNFEASRKRFNERR